MTSAPDSNDALLQRVLVSSVCVAMTVGVMFLVRRSHDAPTTSATQTMPAGVAGLLAALTAQQRLTSAGRVRSHCEGAVADPCGCMRAAVHEALDASLVETARAFLPDANAACPEPLKGQRSEILVRSGATKEAAQVAKETLAKQPTDPYASYTLAQATWAAGDANGAERFAESAVTNGRGNPAHLVIGLLALERNDVEAARGAFARALESEPNDVASLYNLALCDHRLNHYGAAREGYLAVLRLNPRHADARYNLILLTNGAGFHDEAVHYLSEFRAVVPNDPRIPNLEAGLAPAPPPVASAAVPPASSGAHAR